MTEKLGSLYIARHATAQQESADMAALAGLSDEQFRATIRELNMRQGLDHAKGGPTQADHMGKFLAAELQGQPTPVAVTGPFRRHRETAEGALLRCRYP